MRNTEKNIIKEAICESNDEGFWSHNTESDLYLCRIMCKRLLKIPLNPEELSYYLKWYYLDETDSIENNVEKIN